jgi:hypothetical protein
VVSCGPLRELTLHILKPSRLTTSGALGGGARWKAMAAAAAVADAPGKTLP